MTGVSSVTAIGPVAGVLVGGGSRRMGRDKALIDVGGETLLERTLRVAKSSAGQCSLVGDAPFSLPSSVRHVRRVPDAANAAGPIAGLLGMLNAFPGSPVLLLACDMPNLGAALLETLVRAARTETIVAVSDAIVPLTIEVGRERTHPCCAVYLPTAKTHVESAVDAGRFRMMSLLDALRVHRVNVAGEDAAQLLNWNTPLDLPGGGAMPSE
ncbi:MAG TPA: molybdenum cofactor guanylyltransferase [Phycisphaerae bacterium]|nr:molybdenum cofactor guanylyltransferase [Phycisphaerae bacterium]